MQVLDHLKETGRRNFRELSNVCSIFNPFKWFQIFKAGFEHSREFEADFNAAGNFPTYLLVKHACKHEPDFNITLSACNQAFDAHNQGRFVTAERLLINEALRQLSKSFNAKAMAHSLALKADPNTYERDYVTLMQSVSGKVLVDTEKDSSPYIVEDFSNPYTRYPSLRYGSITRLRIDGHVIGITRPEEVSQNAYYKKMEMDAERESLSLDFNVYNGSVKCGGQWLKNISETNYAHIQLVVTRRENIL